MKVLSKGLISPFVRLASRVSAFWRAVADCLQSQPPLSFTASGFAGDHGAVRIWRKDTNDEVHLLSVLARGIAAARRPANIVGRVIRFRLLNSIFTANRQNIFARVSTPAFGELSFMQREVGAASSFPTIRLPCIAIAPNKSVRPVTPLRPGGSYARTRWHADHTVTTCEGETLKPIRIPRAQPHIERRQNHQW